ncbi:hypothetical protein CDAR_60081 [Caerostris darwini]|uniref:Uncharacterized protein n=1 Tax=Caerostris darwini TaxID=1538125 RepID=A0AAV4QJY7_9ARAC|nr:hypothetical protein CDAR_60081 [Caerostris darwini]
MSNSCRQECLRLSLGVGAFYLHLKRSLSNSIPQGMKSIRKGMEMRFSRRTVGVFSRTIFFRIFFIEDKCCSFLLHSYSVTLSISTASIRTSLSKKRKGVRGWTVVLMGKILEECRLHS